MSKRVENIMPFRYIDVYSPDEAEERGVIAHGELNRSEYPHEGHCIYLGPADHGDEIPAKEKRFEGPFVNHGESAGDRKAVVEKVDFGSQGSVYISGKESLPGKYGVWEKVRSLTQ